MHPLLPTHLGLPQSNDFLDPDDESQPKQQLVYDHLIKHPHVFNPDILVTVHYFVVYDVVPVLPNLRCVRDPIFVLPKK
jgi:hypothetical protein